MYTTHSVNSVIAANEVGVGYGSIASLYGPHWLTEIGERRDMWNVSRMYVCSYSRDYDDLYQLQGIGKDRREQVRGHHLHMY